MHQHIHNYHHNSNYNYISTSNYDNLNTCHQLLCAHFSRLADRCVGGTFSFSAVSTCDGAVVDGTYVWEIVPASTIGSSIAEDTGLFTAGNNTTGSDMTEIVQVTDITHNTIDTAEATVHPVQPVCETAINPSAATIDSEESITFGFPSL